MQQGYTVVVKRHLSAYENIENDPKAPHVDLGSGVGPGTQELGRRKVVRAAGRVKLQGGRVEVRETETNDLGVART